MNAITTNIRQIRLIKDYTQEYVASQIGVSAEWYSKMENGKAKINTDQLDKLAKVFDVNPGYFYSFQSSHVFDHCDQKGALFGVNKLVANDKDIVFKLIETFDKIAYELAEMNKYNRGGQKL